MVPQLLAIFGLGAAGAIVLAISLERRSLWVAAFGELLIFLHEISFVLLPGGTWVRTDLLLILPAFTAITAWLAVYAIRRSPGLGAPILLSLGALAAPLWFLVRERF